MRRPSESADEFTKSMFATLDDVEAKRNPYATAMNRSVKQRRRGGGHYHPNRMAGNKIMPFVKPKKNFAEELRGSGE